MTTPEPAPVVVEPEPEAAGPAAEEVAPEPVAEREWEPEPEPEREPVAEPVPEPVGAGPLAAEPARVATRFCPGCQERVALAADGLHCRDGHRLSPAHARRRFGLLRRR